MFAEEKDVERTLELAKKQALIASQASASRADWQRAQFMLQLASRVDGLSKSISTNGELEVHPSPLGTRSAKLPIYYVLGEKLVKEGAKKSREGELYFHRVTRNHFDEVVEVLSSLSKKGKSFETSQVVSLCTIPKHEPGIVLAVLRKQKLVTSERRGNWEFTRPATFRTEVETAWEKIPRRT